MKQQHFLSFLYSLEKGDLDEAFRLIHLTYGIETAIEALAIGKGERDVEVLRFLKAQPELDRKLIEDTLIRVWGEDRLLDAKDAREFFFFISLSNDGESKFRIGTTVTLQRSGVVKIWYHHVDSNDRCRTAEECIIWDRVDPEDEAMWVLLVSKIERLPENWYIEAAKAANASLLIPYDLDEREE